MQHRSSSRAVTRRQVITGGGALLGTMVSGLHHASGTYAAQVDSTPPVAPQPTFPPQTDPIGALAADLGYDQEAMFAFVRDEIHYESYAGVLRGATGTLWARAGNSADQATLLGALLTASQIPFRYATGSLDDDAIAALVAELTSGPETVNQAYNDALLVAVTTVLGLEDPSQLDITPDATATSEIEGEMALATEALEIVARSSATSNDTIHRLLQQNSIALPDTGVSVLPDRERLSHAWVQVADGPSWIDLDPVLPAEVAPPVPTSTFAEFADDWQHRVQVRLAVDEFVYGGLARRDVATLSATSARLVNVPISVQLAPADAIAGLGSTVNQLFTGQRTIAPSIFADGTVVEASTTLAFGTDQSSALDAFGDGTPVAGAQEGETVAVWIAVDITSPDAAPITVERPLLDRVPLAQRLAGTFDPASIEPLKSEPSALASDNAETIAEFNRFYALSVDVGRIPAEYALAYAQANPDTGVFALFGPTLAAQRDALGVRYETEAGFWSYPSAPNVTLFTFDSAAGTSPDQPGMFIDAMYRQRAIFPVTDDAPLTAGTAEVLLGVLNATAEEMMVLPQLRGASASEGTGSLSVSGIFQQAADDGIESVLVATVDDLSGVDLEEDARLRIEATLRLGQVVIVPAQPVDVMGSPTTAWWIIDPATGRTSDSLQDGSAGAGAPGSGRRAARAQDTQAWYTRWIAWLAENAKTMNCVGTIVGAIGGVAVLILAMSSSPLLAAISTGTAIANIYKIPNACL